MELVGFLDFFYESAVRCDVSLVPLGL